MKNVLKAFGVIALIAVIGFAMAACDDGGASHGPSGTSGGALPAPTGLRVTSTTSTEITLAWNAVAGATGYNIYGSLSSSSGFDKKGYWQGTIVNINNLSPNTTAYFYVTAVNANGTESARSNTISGTTSGGTPTTPDAFSFTGNWKRDGDGLRVAISANANGGFDGIITDLGNSPVTLDAAQKGWVKIGDTKFWGIRKRLQNYESGDYDYYSIILAIRPNSDNTGCRNTGNPSVAIYIIDANTFRSDVSDDTENEKNTIWRRQ